MKQIQTKRVKGVYRLYIIAFALLFLLTGNINIARADFGSTSTDTFSSYDTAFTTNHDITNFFLTSGDGHGQDLGTGILQSVDSFSLYIDQVGSNSSLFFQMFECDDSDYSTATCSVVHHELWYAVEDEFYTYEFGTGWAGDIVDQVFNFDPSLYYVALWSDNTTIQSDRIIATSTVDIYSGGACYRNCDTAVDISFEFFSTENVSGLYFDYPVPNSTVGSPVTFSGTFDKGILYFDHIYLWIVADDPLTDDIGHLIPISSDQTGTFSTSLEIPAGNYSFTARLYDEPTYVFGEWYPNLYAIAPSFTVGDLPTAVYEVCSTLDFFCYIKNAFVWAVTADQQAIDQFNSLKDLLKTKAPFGYAFGIYEAMTNIENDEINNVFSLEEVEPIQTQIFAPIRAGLTWFLYFAFMFMLFKRFKDISV